jgi:hypothetical protein
MEDGDGLLAVRSFEQVSQMAEASGGGLFPFGEFLVRRLRYEYPCSVVRLRLQLLKSLSALQ